MRERKNGTWMHHHGMRKSFRALQTLSPTESTTLSSTDASEDTLTSGGESTMSFRRADDTLVARGKDGMHYHEPQAYVRIAGCTSSRSFAARASLDLETSVTPGSKPHSSYGTLRRESGAVRSCRLARDLSRWLVCWRGRARMLLQPTSDEQWSD